MKLPNSLPSFLTSDGRAKIRTARKEEARLERKESLKGHKGLKQQEILARGEYRALLARHNRDVRIAWIFAGLGAIGGAGVFLHENKDNRSTANINTVQPPVTTESPSNSVPRAEAERIIDQLIPKIETGMARLHQRLLEKVDQMGGRLPAPYLVPEAFWGPFEVIELSKRNPARNYERFQRQARTGRIEDINWIFYNRLPRANEAAPGYDPNIHRMAAAFSPPFRAVNISEDFNPDSLMDVLVAYHEVRHAMNDAVIRSGMNSRESYDRYMAFAQYSSNNDRARVIIEDETGAYAYEIEALNVLLDDQLRQRAGNINVETAARSLGVTLEHDKSLLGMLIDLAKIYYPHGMTGRVFNNAFPRAICANYERMGYDCYSGNPAESVVRFRP